MRLINLGLIAAVLIAGCSDPTQPAEQDAGVDGGRVDGGLDGMPGPIDGTWRLAWTCADNCSLPEPSVSHSDTLVIAGNKLDWSDTECMECTAAHTGTAHDMCVDVAAQTVSIEQLAAYSACVNGDGALEMTIAVRRVGGTGLASTWRATGRRQ